MFVVYLIAAVVISYLAGSINGAIVVTSIVKKTDIRDLGNQMAGTANVGRSIGKGWATGVFFWDVVKGLVPMILAEQFVFKSGAYYDYLAICAMGIAAIVGHCKPVFFRFKGGGGMATSLGVFSFFIPVELGAAMLLGFGLVMLLMKNVEFKIGRYVPMVIVTITPFFTLALNYLLDIRLGGRFSIGGHPWYIIVNAFAIALTILFINLSILIHEVFHKPNRETN